MIDRREEKTLEDLGRTLRGLDGKGYKAYKPIRGVYAADAYTFFIDHVQGDPFADPSRVRVRLDAQQSGLPEWTRSARGRRISTADFIGRCFYRVSQKKRQRKGTGRSGEIRMLRPGQQVLERTSTVVEPGGALEVRFYVGLPAQGRRILGRYASELLTETLPSLVEESLPFAVLDADALKRHVETVEDAQALRAQLEANGLVAFAANGSVLPRASGVDDRPLASDSVVELQAPESLEVELDRPNAGPVRGLGIPRGVTLIVGGGFHGKSTLLRGIERGVYEHIPGDGREAVVALSDAMKVRAEDGRAIRGVDISNFIDRLPGGEDTSAFDTDNASGSTSQAAAIIEALEIGTTCLLLDEDTSATNFMIRDARMQELIADEMEPITPFIDRARALAESVSTVLVVGGSGDYFDVADTVIGMQHYVPHDLTAQAQAIAGRRPTERKTGGGGWRPPRERIVDPDSVDASKGRKQVSIKIPTDDRVLFGGEEVRLAGLEQVVEVAQMRAVAEALAWAAGPGEVLSGHRDLAAGLRALLEHVEAHGLEAVQARLQGNLAAFRIQEAAGFLNRLRSLRLLPAGPAGTTRADT